jgi:hypothetical protein
MDVIDASKNRVVTDCGHIFHCSCLMQNAVHNGFGCPFCRTAMAEEPQEEADEEDEWSDVSDDEGDEREMFDDHVLRSMRFMFNNIEGIPHDILDVHDENEYQQEEAERANRATEAPTNVPNAAFIAAKLIQQGVTMEQIIKCLMVHHEEYDDLDMFNDLDQTESDIFGKMRIIISNYSPDEAIPTAQVAAEPPSTPLPHPIVVVAPAAPVRQANNNASEPKSHTHIIPRRLDAEFMECAAE